MLSIFLQFSLMVVVVAVPEQQHMRLQILCFQSTGIAYSHPPPFVIKLPGYTHTKMLPPFTGNWLSASPRFSRKRFPVENCMHSIWIWPSLLQCNIAAVTSETTSDKSTVNHLLQRTDCFVAVQDTSVFLTCITHFSYVQIT